MNKNKIILYTLLLVSSLILFQGYVAFTGDFRTSTITYDWPQRHQWSLPETSSDAHENIQGILNQNFSYLGQGNQTYAFISDDGKHVLKFFKFGHLKPKEWLKWIPDIGPIKQMKKNTRDSQENKLQRIFQGHWIALTHNKENCGLITAQLDPSSKYDQSVEVRDRIGVIRTINLNTTVFALQEKALVARELFNKYLMQNDLKQTELLIDKIFELYRNEYSRCVYDRDHNVIDNVGFSKGKAIHIDVGKLRYDVKIQNKDNYLPDVKDKVVKRISTWVNRYYPQHSRHIDEYLKEKVTQLQAGSLDNE